MLRIVNNNGVYGTREAANLVGVSPARLRRWFGGSRQGEAPILAPDCPPVAGRHAISFHDLVDAALVARLWSAGVREEVIRRAREKLEEMLGTPHPFAHQGLMADGGVAWLRGCGCADDAHQLGVVRRFAAGLDYEPSTQMASQWRIAPGVAVNPNVAFGRPCTVPSRRPTSLLHDAYLANGGDTEVVAAWYVVAAKEVRYAVTFESELWLRPNPSRAGALVARGE